MFFSIMVALMVLLVVMFSARQGLFSALIMFVESAVACMVAFDLYETVYDLIHESIGPGIGFPLSLMAIFLVMLLLLRVASDKLIPGNVHVHQYLNWAGGSLFGLFTGLIVVGTALIAIEMLPIGSSLFGFERYQQDDEGLPVRKNLTFKPDAFVAGMLDTFSTGRFGGDNPFAHAKPGLIDDLYSARCSTQTEARHVLPKDALAVQACWDASRIDVVTHEIVGGQLKRTFTTSESLGMGSTQKFFVCRVHVSSSAQHEKNPAIRFRLPQFRIVGPPPSQGATGPDPAVYLAAGMSDLYINVKHDRHKVSAAQVRRLVRFGSQTDFILDASATGTVASEGGYTFDVAFEVPEDFEPWYLEFKRGARFEFPRDPKAELYRSEPPAGASGAIGTKAVAESPTPASPPRPKVGQAPGGRTHIATATEDRTGVLSTLPFALDGSAPILQNYVGGDRKFHGGQVHLESPTGEIAEDVQVTEFFVPPGKKMVQISAEAIKAESLFGKALGGAAGVAGQIYIKTSDDREYFAIGSYAEAPIGNTRWIEIRYFPDYEVPERALKRHAPKKVTKRVLQSTKSKDRKFGYLFLVDPGVTIVSFHAGARGQQSQPLNIAVP
ncbi:MAG: CvpA family protein [Phycisphaerae bacterium]